MKKLFFILLPLGLLSSVAQARCSIKPEYPGSGGAHKAYCWEVAYITDQERYDLKLWEDTRDKSSTSVDFNGTIYTLVNVYGYGDSTSANLDFAPMILIAKAKIYNEFDILIGKRYLYKSANNNISRGMVRAMNNSSMKDQVYMK